ncbi:MAG: hypothetical protein ACOYIH_04525 [Candidatus Fimadaptatus sp.]|jgi:hypothetical protein
MKRNAFRVFMTLMILLMLMQSAPLGMAEGELPTAEPTATPVAEPTLTPTPEPTAEPVLPEGLRLNVESLSVELQADQTGSVPVAELELMGAGEDVAAEWLVSSRTGSSADIVLEQEQGRARVYAVALGEGESEFEISVRCTAGVQTRELSAVLRVNVTQPKEFVPAAIEGVDIIYNMAAGASLTIAPSNAGDFPEGTLWQLEARMRGLDISDEGEGAFSVSAAREGRYVALMSARSPEGEERMAYMMFVVSGQEGGNAPALNYEALDIVLDVDNPTGEAVFHVRPAESLGYVPAAWRIEQVAGEGAVRLRMERKGNGVDLHASPNVAGEAAYLLRCRMPSLDASVTIPVRVRVRHSDDGVTGITLRRDEYSMRLDEAITLSPYALPEGNSCPRGTAWSASAQGEGKLALNVDAATGQTTIMASHAGRYNVVFSAQVSANRVYTAEAVLIVTD